MNKASYAFSIGLLSFSTFAPMAAGMVPPLALATFIARCG